MAKTAKKAAKQATARNSLNWPLPGSAYSTIYFREAGSFAGIFLGIMPGFDSALRRETLIGDDIVANDFLDINHFESALLQREASARFITVAFINRSQTAKTFELAFVFGGDSTASQRFTYSLGAREDLVDYINVTLIP